MAFKVFILEDSLNRVRLFEEVLKGQDYWIRDKVKEAKEVFEKHGPWDLILLDHDLNDFHYANQDAVEETGTEFAKWLSTLPPKGSVVIHSFNMGGAERMHKLLTDSGWHTVRMPFGMQLLKLVQTAFNPQ